MATVTQETIVVEKVNQYGVRAGGNKQYNKSQKYTGPELEAGKAYEAEVYVSDKGAKYINSAKQTEGSVSIVPSVAINATNATIPSVSKEAYWEKKNEALKYGGLFHDAAELVQGLIVAQGLDEEGALRSFERVTRKLVEFRNSLDQ